MTDFILNRLTFRRLMMPLSALVFFAVWQTAAVTVSSDLILPPPGVVLGWVFQHGTEAVFLRHLGSSCLRVLFAIVLTILAGSVLGICSGLFGSFRVFLSFPLTVIRAAPVVSIILLAVFWLGTNALPVFISALMALPVMIDSVSGGIQKTPQRLVDVMRVYGFSRVKILRHVFIPAAFPGFLSGSRSVFGLCWKVVAAGEVLALPRFGAGSLLYSAKLHLETTKAFAITVVLIVLCFLFENGFVLFAKIKNVSKGRGKPSPAAVCPEGDTGRSEASPGNLQRGGGFLCLENIRVTRGSKKLYHDFSVKFEQCAVTALIAASGRGKTTLLDCIAGIIKPDSGRIYFRSGEGSPGSPEISEPFRVSYLFQEPELLPWRSIGQNISLPLQTFFSLQNEKSAAMQKAYNFLLKTGLDARYTAYPSDLSGGERRRASIARAFCYPAPVFLMDEAFQSQDLPLKLSLMRLTKLLMQEEMRTTILVTHDVREALCLADRILVLTGEPLLIARDIVLPDSQSVGGHGARTITDRYIHLTGELSAIEEDILEVLSKDSVHDI
jgi:ABC-type nitrate/sulfonate/bicarbonate transport system ATPase subunit/ABC-type nitrate/sulfonate/bicarbonate transport system permease component